MKQWEKVRGRDVRVRRFLNFAKINGGGYRPDSSWIRSEPIDMSPPELQVQQIENMRSPTKKGIVGEIDQKKMEPMISIPKLRKSSSNIDAKLIREDSEVSPVKFCEDALRSCDYGQRRSSRCNEIMSMCTISGGSESV